MHRKKVDKLPFIILAGIIILIVAIISITVSTIKNKKTAEVYVNVIQEENKIENDILIVEVENNIEENIEANIIDNEIIEENILASEITEENTTQNETESKETIPKQNQGGKKYKLEVNCEQNVVNVYTKDENGEYTNCVKAMLCSVGPATPTSGTYSLKKYSAWEWKGLFGDVYGQYATQITGNILFHSVPYTEKYNNASLEYWEYDKLGTSASMGCVRLTVKNAKWIYDNCEAGTLVKFYKDSNPGPLGKPTEQKISSEEEYRNWDPTDPNPNNPWKNYSKDSSLSSSVKENTEKVNTVNDDRSNEDDIKKDSNKNNVNNNTNTNVTNDTDSKNNESTNSISTQQNEIKANNTTKNELNSSNTTNKRR